MPNNNPFTFHVTQPISDRDPSEGKLENGYYTASVVYIRDFETDSAKKDVDYRLLSATAEPKRTRGRRPRIELPNLRISDFTKREHDRLLLPSHVVYLKPDETDELIEKLKIAKESITALRTAINAMMP